MMHFKVNKKDLPPAPKYSEEDLKIARDFSKKAMKEFGSFLKAIVLFGSAARRDRMNKPHDVDILLVINDLTLVLSAEVVEAYRIILERISGETSDRLHVTTLRFTNFWEYVRNGDPIAINILRDGVAIFDSGFFDPLQALLYMGRIRPTYESIWTYFQRAPNTLYNSKWHLLQATLDLYWAVIDSAHAVLMKVGEVPPSPAHVADLMNEVLVKKGRLEKKYVKTMKFFYDISKQIVRREVKEITGSEYSRYLKDAEDFVERMKKFLKA